MRTRSHCAARRVRPPACLVSPEPMDRSAKTGWEIAATACAWAETQTSSP